MALLQYGSFAVCKALLRIHRALVWMYRALFQNTQGSFSEYIGLFFQDT